MRLCRSVKPDHVSYLIMHKAKRECIPWSQCKTGAARTTGLGTWSGHVVLATQKPLFRPAANGVQYVALYGSLEVILRVQAAFIMVDEPVVCLGSVLRILVSRPEVNHQGSQVPRS